MRSFRPDAGRPIGGVFALPPRSGAPAIADPSAPPREVSACGADATLSRPSEVTRDPAWLRAARQAKWLAWASLGWMTIEGVIGLVAGIQAGSIALVGWALSSAVEGMASVIVAWRFSGTRTLSEAAERIAQRGVALSFFLLAPFVAAEAVRDLISVHHPDTTWLGIALTAVALLEMPLLGRTKQRLGDRLSSRATTGEGRQNYICGAQAAAVLASLAITTIWPGGWWLDPLVAIGIAGWALYEGVASWRGEACGC